MTVPSPLTGRGRGVAKRRGFRQKPIRRPGAEALEEEAAWPEHVYTIPGARRAIPPGELDAARARWVRLVLDDPAAARRERLEAKLRYWRARVEALQTRFRIAKQAVIDALEPTEGPDDRPLPPVPAAVIHELRIQRTVAWADLRAAKARLAEIERELEQ